MGSADVEQVSGRRDRRTGAHEASRPSGAGVGSGDSGSYRLTMADLQHETGISPRTIRYYITEGLLPSAKGRGVGATYGAAHLLRLKAIALLRERHIPLEEIRKRLSDMRDGEVAGMLHAETAPPEDRWRRIQLDENLELHVRERVGSGRDYEFDRAVETIVRQAQVVLDQLGSHP